MAGEIDMKLYVVEYLGSTQIDKRFSRPMVRWVIAEIKKRGFSEKVCVGVQEGLLVSLCLSTPLQPQPAPPPPPPAHGPRLWLAPGDYGSFLYVVRDAASPQLLTCHLYRAADPSDVVELFNAMREQSKDPAVLAGAKERSLSSAAALGPDISPSTSHYFEVFYIGKIKVTHKRVPDTFIDDALEKFRAHEAEKERLKAQKTSGNHINNSFGSNSNINKTESSSTLNNVNASNNTSSNNIADNATINNNGNSVPAMDGSAVTVANSNSNPSLKTCKNNNVIEQNECDPEALKRNVRGEVNLQDKSSSAESLITRSMSDVNAASEITSKKCDEAIRSDSGCVTPTLENPVAPIKQLPPLEPMRARAASTGSARDFRKGDSAVSSDNRTMLFLVGRVDLRLISPDRKQTLLHKHLKDVASCIQGISNPEHFGFICREANVEGFIAYVFKCESASVADDVVGAITQAFVATSEAQRRERMPVFSCDHCPMVWYSRLCAEIEGQNEKRTQTTILRRLEGLPEVEQESILTKFGGAETQGLQEQNEFLMMLLRAHCESKQARHVHDTAENRHEFLNQYLGGSTIFMKAKRSLTNSFDQLLKRKGSRDDFGPMLKEMSLPSNATLCKESISNTSSRASPTSDHMEPVPDSPNASSQRRHAASGSNSDLHFAGIHQKDSPMKNIFLKVGSSPISPGKDATGSSRQSGSWRQSIFDSVTPKKVRPDGSPVVLDGPQKLTKRDRAELRALWRKAINQQLLLIRMERENARLRARQEEATVKRLKLEYDEIGSCVRELVEVWDLLLSRESSVSTRCDRQMLLQAIKQGVPRTKRGEVWQFLADQYCLNQAPPDISKFPNYNVPYESLLKQLTAHQHVILIDLGRTFPSHPFFSRPLGPGQLSLFNLLKAYSLLDPEVGYCQGLSFVAGVLLLHMSEECAFFMLRHLMLQRGMRRQYVPDMGALQVQLYQISRLLRDMLPDLYAHFDTHDIAPTLYAAPWVLTLFASQFPLGFVVRVFDLIFFESTDVVVRVAVALLNEHREGLLACDNFEEIMDYLKGKVPSIDKPMLDRIMKQVFTSDVSKQLHDYEVEYHVLKEEMASPRVDMETVHRLEAENRSLIEQLEIATNATHRQQQSINKLEAQVRSLEVSITTMGNFISELVETRKDIEIPGEVRRLIQQVAVVERRKSTTQKPKIEALKTPAPSVIETPATEVQRSSSAADEISSQHRGQTPYPLKSALSSPNLSARLTGVSALFSSAHNNNKQHKPNAAAPPTGSTKSCSLTADRDLQHKVAQPNGLVKNQGRNTPETIKTLSDTSTLKSESPLASKPKPLRPSQSSYELTTPIVKLVDDSGDSGNVTPTSPSTQIHPLDSCLGVNFSFSGTTKLKTIRPLRANLQRNPSSDSLKINPGTDGLDIVSLRPKEQQPLVVGVNPQSNGVLTR